jgi:predicted AAA+ superfamily ATPase
VLFKVKYYDIKGKSILKTKAKYYAGDLGILSSTTSYDVNKEIGFRLENLVYLELLNRDYKVYTYADKYDREIDFVCEKNNKISY